MAELVVSLVIVNLDNSLLREVFGGRDVRDEAEKLRAQLLAVESKLESASRKQLRGEAGRAWLSQLTKLSHEVEDLLHTISPETTYRFILWSFLTLKKIKSRLQLHNKLKIMNKLIAELSSQVFWPITEGRNPLLNITGNSLSLNSGEASVDRTIVGLEEEKSAIIYLLLQLGKHRQVISIVGMSGVGKTTLAFEVFRDIEIRRYFPTRAWVNVRHSSFTDILKQIKTQIARQPSDRNTLPESRKDLIGGVKRLLSEQGRYLIVMDDVWSPTLWHEMQTAIPDAQDGSRVIFTMRSLDVAERVSPDTYRLMPVLNEEDSLNLLLRRANPGGSTSIQNVPTDLKEIGEKIVQRCRSLPLALVSIGGLLKFKGDSPSAWDQVLKYLEQDDDGYGSLVPRALNLIYHHLPSSWKLCFVYISIFPEDYHISARRLIRLWRAEQLILQESHKSMEETAYMILDQLIQLSLVQVVEYRYTDKYKVKRIKVHGVVHQFCISKARDALFYNVLLVHKDNSLISLCPKEHNFSLENTNYYCECISSPSEKSKDQKVRSFLGFNSSLKFDVSLHSSYFRPKLLSVIDIEGLSESYKLPEEITSMPSLRYLRWIVATDDTVHFQSSIQIMCNLETLDIHPQVTGPDKDMDGIGFLKNLHTLKRVIAGKWIQRNLANLTNLCKLRIHDLTTEHMEVLVKLLNKLCLLVSLTLQSSAPIPTEVLTIFRDNHPLRVLKLLGQLEATELPDSKNFPAHLEKLVLLSSMLEVDPMESLEKVQSLKLVKFGHDAYKGRKMTCSSEGFPKLEHLMFEELENFEEWEVKDGAIPQLKHLSIYFCMHSERIVKGVENRQTLVIDIIPTAASRIKEEPSAETSSSSCPSSSSNN